MNILCKTNEGKDTDEADVKYNSYVFCTQTGNNGTRIYKAIIHKACTDKHQKHKKEEM